MVTLSQTISTKIKDIQGDITEDEVSFRSNMLSLVFGACNILPVQLYSAQVMLVFSQR